MNREASIARPRPMPVARLSAKIETLCTSATPLKKRKEPRITMPPTRGGSSAAITPRKTHRVFRGVIAALLPPLVGGIVILGSFLFLRGVAEVHSVSIFALNLATGMGLGLAIDASLFMVSRYREEMANGLAPDKAIGVTMRTAGRTVFFSALTVAAAAASLTVFKINFLWSMGAAGVIVA